MAQGGSGGGYALNPFAAGTAGVAKTQARADGLRGYGQNKFAGGSAGESGRQAAHLSQAVPLEADLLQAYREVGADPKAAQYNQTVPDLEKMWRMTPNAAIFKPTYQHNPYVLERRDLIGIERENQAKRDAGLVFDEDSQQWRDPSQLRRGSSDGD